MGLIGPLGQIDMFNPLVLAAIRDHVNNNHELTTAGSAQVINTGRGMGIVPGQARIPLFTMWPFKCSNALSTGGCYIGSLGEPGDTLVLGTEGGALASTMLWTYPDDDDTVYVNINEITKTTHALMETFEVLEFLGLYMGINDDGRHVLYGSGFQIRPCPPPG